MWRAGSQRTWASESRTISRWDFKGAPTKKLKIALETILEISKGEGVGSTYVLVPSLTGTEMSCEGMHGAEAAVCALALAATAGVGEPRPHHPCRGAE